MSGPLKRLVLDGEDSGLLMDDDAIYGSAGLLDADDTLPADEGDEEDAP